MAKERVPACTPDLLAGRLLGNRGQFSRRGRRPADQAISLRDNPWGPDSHPSPQPLLGHSNRIYPAGSG